MRNEEYIALLQERDSLIAELSIANTEYAFQNTEKDRPKDIGRFLSGD